MRTRLSISLMMFAVAAGCSDQTPTAGEGSMRASVAGTPDPQRDAAALLTNIPVSTTNFSGRLSVTRIEVDRATRQLRFSGTVTRASDGLIDRFTDVPGTLSRSASGVATTTILQQQAPSGSGPCEFLSLGIQPLDLEVLGLTLELSIIRIDVGAVPGPGNSLGNLLCAVTGLLDNAGTTVAAIDAQLDQVNTMLASP